MSILDYAIEHIRAGRYVFPGVPGEKVPAVKKPYKVMTLDEKQILSWWKDNPHYNICIPAGVEVEPGKFLGVIDFDSKSADGFQTKAFLSDLGMEFIETLTQVTPNHGEHMLYTFAKSIGNGAGFLGPGIDHRGFHGYILGAGSWFKGKEYTFKNNSPIATAPDWLAKKLYRSPFELEKNALSPLRLVDASFEQTTAIARGRTYLEKLPVSKEGERNQHAFKIAAKLKDFGADRGNVFQLMSTDWCCEPELPLEELHQAVNSAFKYGQNELGILHVDKAFDVIPPEPKVKHPVDALNDEYAFVVTGGANRILWDTIDQRGKAIVRQLSIQGFHEKLSNHLIDIEGKKYPVSHLWMKSTTRKTYDGIIFEPKSTNKRFFNLWQGFAVKPLEDHEKPPEAAATALALFLEHIHENVCEGDKALGDWFIGYLAHMIQFPEKKPRTCLALRGKKGVGKNVITDCIGHLLGNHYLLAANRRYLSGNFNSHLENLILFVLDEAYWSGDKAAEGILKDLITGRSHLIEHKGQAPYLVDNLLRVIIFGNEKWIVPASTDERRFAVFEVGEKRRRDDVFFGKIKDGVLNHGGDRLLLRYLLDVDISKVDINVAPNTDALMDQKDQSLGMFQGWWRQCLEVGYVVGSMSEDWQTQISVSEFRDAFYRQMDAEKPYGKRPGPGEIGKIFAEVYPGGNPSKVKWVAGASRRVYELGNLERARAEWGKFMGGDEKCVKNS